MRCVLVCCLVTDCVGCGVNIQPRRAIAGSRKEAIKRGSITYTGAACGTCGSKIRYTSTCQCRLCGITKGTKRKYAKEDAVSHSNLKTRNKIEDRLEELALMRELDCLS